MNIADASKVIAESEADARALSGMPRAITRLLMLVGAGIVVIVAIVMSLVWLGAGKPGSPPIIDLVVGGGTGSSTFLLRGALLASGALVAIAALFYGLRKLEPTLDANASAQAQFLDNIASPYVDVAIALSAALSLFLELALIRWQSSVLEFLAFYKNFSLLACFAGLGLGYALATRSRIPLLMVIPLLAVQFCFIMLTRMVPGVFDVIPFREQLTMGLGQGNASQVIVLYLLLSVIFLLTALTLLPIGQLCGRLMERRSNLRAYGLNLLGSVLGVLVMLAASWLWTPPLVWFALCFLGILMFHLRRPSSLIAGIGFSLICTIALAWWPIDRLWNRIYSPYQLIEIGTNEDTGLALILAAGHYYQHINDLSARNAAPSKLRDFYDFPYKAHPTSADVAVVGSGTGNDVAAALRADAGKVDAIEIDPVIIEVGKRSHPEKPYENPRVNAINNDARSFLRTTTNKYDVIVYGMLDSHTLLSPGSSVRLDSFVYTVEGLREARSRLKPDGMISLAFWELSKAHSRKIDLMLQEAFDGRSPVCAFDGTMFLISNDPNWTPPPDLNASTGACGNPMVPASISTDDWPFFYMPQRVYPVSYLVMISQILALSLLLVGNFVPESPRFNHLSFFFLGAGFMLVETKGITELGLTFGNTWQVIGIVIAGILIMAFLGNCLVQWLSIKRRVIPYLCLFAALAVGWLAAGAGGFPSTPLGRLETVVVLSMPFVFSGIVFSTLLSTTERISGVMAMNLLGAIVGGLLEYNSMYFGFRALYLMAMVCYLLAFLSELVLANRDADRSAVHASAQGR
jgi:hypothetical protein